MYKVFFAKDCYLERSEIFYCDIPDTHCLLYVMNDQKIDYVHILQENQPNK